METFVVTTPLRSGLSHVPAAKQLRSGPSFPLGSSATLTPHAVASGVALAAAIAAIGRTAARRNAARSKRCSWTQRRATEVKERKLNERQKQFWETVEEYFEADVVPSFGKENLGRVFEFMQYCKYEKDIPQLAETQESDPEYFPGLRAKPWWDKSEIEGDWIQKMKEGLPYVQEELADLLELDEAAMVSDSVRNEVMGGGWTGFRLQRLGEWLPKNCARFPQTVQLLKTCGVPLAMRGVIVARQAPETGVNPHSDGRNMFLTAHFGLSVPEECDITVGGETRKWIEDDCIILDTSFQHSTRNQSIEDRFVLIVDFWHPDLTVAEREALEYIYDIRTKFEQGKIKYRKKISKDFFTALHELSAVGGAYTEERIARPQNPGEDSLGGFRLGKW